MPRLIVSQNGQEYRVVAFTAAVTIGREPDNDIVLASPQVSRHHASIGRQENGDYLLFDHGSSSARASHSHRGGGDAELLFERLDHIVQFHHGHRANGFEDVFFGDCHFN